MPNWCENELTVTGPSDELARFRDYARSGSGRRAGRVLSEEPFIPYPDDYRVLDDANAGRWLSAEGTPIPPDKQALLTAKGFDLTRDGFNQGGYEWSVKNWGTKWGFCEPRLVEVTAHALGYGFSTAWSPPRPLILKMSAMFPELAFHLEYWEGGEGYQGVLVCQNGQEVDDSVSDYDGDRGG